MSDRADRAEVTVLLFARLRDEAGTDQLRVAWRPRQTVADVAALVRAQRPDVHLRGSLVAVNETYAAPDRPVGAGDTVAFLPPISGG